MTVPQSDRQNERLSLARGLFRTAVDDLVSTLGRLDESHLAAVAALATLRCASLPAVD